MQIDYTQLDKVLSTLPYPLDKEEVCAQAQQAGANPQMVNTIRQVLPDKTFNSPEDIKKCIPRGGSSRH